MYSVLPEALDIMSHKIFESEFKGTPELIEELEKIFKRRQGLGAWFHPRA